MKGERRLKELLSHTTPSALQGLLDAITLHYSHLNDMLVPNKFFGDKEKLIIMLDEIIIQIRELQNINQIIKNDVELELKRLNKRTPYK